MKNIFIQNINLTEYSNSKNLEELVKDTYERLEVITESLLENKKKRKKNKKTLRQKFEKKKKMKMSTQATMY